MDNRLKRLNDRFYNPAGKHLWLAYGYAKAVKNVIIRSLEEENILTEMDCRIIAKTAEHLKHGDPCFNPFTGGRAFNISSITVSRDRIIRALGG